MSRSDVAKAAVLSGVLATALLTACSGGHRSPAAAPTTPAATAATAAPSGAGSSPSAAVAGDKARTDPGALLQSAALSQSDLPAGFSISLMNKGDQVTGQTTLDSCNYHYATESKRIARRQFVLSQHGQPAGASNELVAYDSDHDAAAALTEFRTAVAHCSKTAGNDLSIQVLTVRSSDPGLPVPDNETVTFRLYDDSGHQEFDIMIFQRHSRYLDGVYLGQPTAFTASDLSKARTLARATGAKLAKLS